MSRPDPLELFRRLPEIAVDESEVHAMQESVRLLRRTAELEEAAPPPVRARALWGTLAAAALLAVLILPGGAERPSLVSPESARLVREVGERIAGLPLVEELATVASLYEIEAGDLDLVMIVGEDFDF